MSRSGSRPTTQPSTAAGPDTRASLLEAAERLFAAGGIQGVSLRMINVAAGARNASAAHYHFGSKTELIRALLSTWLDTLSRERIEALAAVCRSAGRRRPGLRAVVEAYTQPMLRMLAEPTGKGIRFIKFLARVATDPSVRLEELVSPSFYESLGAYHQLLCEALPRVSPEIVMQRVILGFDLLVAAVVSIDRRGGASENMFGVREVAAFGTQLIDYQVAGLAAPATAPAALEAALTRRTADRDRVPSKTRRQTSRRS